VTDVEPSPGDEPVLFSVYVSWPWRAFTSVMTEEEDIKNAIILLFDAEGKLVHQPVPGGDASTPDPSRPNIKVFTASIPAGTYNAVILANTGQLVNDAPGGLAPGDSKASIIAGLLVHADGKLNSVGIPAWGEIATFTAGAGAPPPDPVVLTRAVSKIDVLVPSAIQSKFKLKSVRLYNYHDKGRLVPEATNWDGSSVTAPSVPPSGGKPTDPAANPLVYDGESVTAVACVDEIYTFEATAGEATTPRENTCLVIGGSYNSGPETFYRIDFTTTVSGRTIYMDLLRNHHYTATIIDVNGPGFDDPASAWNSPPVNIEMRIDRGDIIIGPEEPFLAVNQWIPVLEGEAKTGNQLLIVTSIATGWTLDVTDSRQKGGAAVPWITNLSGSFSGAKQIDTITFDVTRNADELDRIAYIHVTAGNLSIIITVTQRPATPAVALITDAGGTRRRTRQYF
jgi:hypothetical protein